MKNRILSVFCAIAMIATVMSSFVVTASAADAPALTMTVISQATETEPATIEVGYTGIPEGNQIKGMQIEIPVDTSMFTYVDGSATGGLTYDATSNSVKRVFVAFDASAYLSATSDTIGTFQLAIAEGAAAGQTYALTSSVVKFSLTTAGNQTLDNVSVDLTTGEVPPPTAPPEPELPATAYVYTKVLNQPEAVGDTVDIEVSYANIPEGDLIKGIQIEIPVDEKLTVDATSLTGGLAYDATANKVKRVFVAFDASAYIAETSGVIGTFKVTVADTAAIGDSIAVVPDVAKFSLATGGNVTVEMVAGTIVVGAGAEVKPPVDDDDPVDPPVDPEEPEEVPAFETEVETEKVTIADGTKIDVFNVTVAPAADSDKDTVAALIVDDKYQVIFDGKTDKDYAAGWAVVTVSGDKLKDALLNGGSLVDVQISIGGADKVTVSVVDSEGATVVLPTV